MKLNFKKYLISIMALVCLVTFSSCAYIYAKNTPEGPRDDQYESISTSVSVSEESSSVSQSDDDNSSESETSSEATSSSESESSESETSSESESESQSSSVSESYPLSESEYVSENTIDFDGSYTTKEDVALYIYTYGCLPSNFMTKNEARDLGWEGGSLEPYAPGMCIGGNYFGNYEGLLPEAPGREYTECDIDTLGASSRGAKRIVFSNDGLIYYTEDHYESFELLYGEE